MVWQDSDVVKWLEAAAYSLLKYPDKELEKRCDEIIELIGHAQHEDGYLNTYFTVKSPEKRWTNLYRWASLPSGTFCKSFVPLSLHSNTSKIPNSKSQSFLFQYLFQIHRTVCLFFRLIEAISVLTDAKPNRK